LLIVINAARVSAAESFQIEEATVADIQRALRDKALTCHALVQAYLDRIAAYNHKGPSLGAILALNLNALAEADRRDADYARSGLVGPLHCIPLVLKDNYNTADLPTTGGSAALAGAQPRRTPSQSRDCAEPVRSFLASRTCMNSRWQVQR
jgi:amidase